MQSVNDKATMYRMLAAGEFGNTIPQFFSVGEWAVSPVSKRYEFWGVRTLAAGGPCRLNCPREEVASTVDSFRPQSPNISVMISGVGQVTLIADIWDSPSGLVVEGHQYPPRIHNWREMMRVRNRWEGVAAHLLLAKHLNANSLEDLYVLRDRYPSHVYELSTMECCFGTVPHRNAIMWEVRNY